MGKKPDLSKEKHAQILVLHRNGFSLRQISAQLSVSTSCVSRTLKRIENTKSFASEHRSGRPTATSPQTDRFIHRYSKANPFAAATEIQAHLPPTVHTPSVTTIRSRLRNKYGLKSYKPAKKPDYRRKTYVTD